MLLPTAPRFAARMLAERHQQQLLEESAARDVRGLQASSAQLQLEAMEVERESSSVWSPPSEPSPSPPPSPPLSPFLPPSPPPSPPLDGAPAPEPAESCALLLLSAAICAHRHRRPSTRCLRPCGMRHAVHGPPQATLPLVPVPTARETAQQYQMIVSGLSGL